MNDIALAGKATSGLLPVTGDAESRLAGSTALIVLGMHRSGTSALTGMLHHLGVALGEHLMPATPDNPRGYWEHSDIVSVHERLMAALGWGWDDIRSLPAGFEHGEAAQAAGRELLAIVDRDFAGAPLWGLKDPRLCRLMPLWTELFAARADRAALSLGAAPPARRRGIAWRARRDRHGARPAVVAWSSARRRTGDARRPARHCPLRGSRRRARLAQHRR